MPAAKASIRAEILERLVQNGVEAGRRRLAPFEPRQPDPVADHDVVERSVNALEEGGADLLALRVAEQRATVVEPLVGETVVARERPCRIGQRVRHIGLAVGRR